MYVKRMGAFQIKKANKEIKSGCNYYENTATDVKKLGNHAIKTLFCQIADIRSNNQLFTCCSFLFFHFCCMRKRRRRFEVLAGL